MRLNDCKVAAVFRRGTDARKTVKALLLAAIAAASVFASSSGVGATANETIQAVRSIDSMTRAELESAVKAAMPLPVLRLMRWRTPSRNNYAIEMSLTGIPDAPQPAMHVTFHTELDADRALLLDAIRAAGNEARALMTRLGMRP